MAYGSPVISILYLSLSGFLAFVCAQRTRLLAPPTIWSLYILVSLLVYEWVVRTGLTKKDSVFSAMPLDHVAKPYHTVFLFFLAMQVLAVVSTVGLPRPRQQLSFDRTVILRYMDGIVGKGSLLVLFAFWVMSAWHFALIDRDVLWRNYEYLMITDPIGIGADNLFASVYHVIFRFIGLVAVAASVVYMRRGAWIHFVLSAGLAVYPMIFLLASNSRLAAIYFACAAIVNVMISRRPLGLFTWVSVGLVLLTFTKVLIGRGLPIQGISAIDEGFAAIEFQKIPLYLEGFVTNVFPIALNFANTVVLDPNHVFEYKIKSFSPLFGFMDNFQATRQAYEIRISAANPISAFGEVFSFGWKFLLVFLAGCFIWMRSVSRLIIEKLDALAILLSIMSIFLVATMGSYSLRTSWRVMLIVTIIALVLHGRRRLASRRNRQTHPRRKRNARLPAPSGPAA